MKMDKNCEFCPNFWTKFINKEVLRIGMDEYEFVKMMEERKLELVDAVKGLGERDIVKKILSEVHEFKSSRNNRIYIYFGLRGIGKTTAMIQALSKTDAGYIDGSVLSYYNLALFDVIREYKRTTGYNVFFIDELTDIRGWGNALKLAYDSKRIKIIATGSSAIKITTEKNRIARRATFEEIPPLTFREFLRIFKKKDVPIVDQNIILSKPDDAYIKAKADYVRVPDLSNEIKEYMQYGFPLFLETRDISRTSEQILESIITKDMPEIEGFNVGLVDSMEKIISTIAISPPGVTSLSKLSNIGGCSKTTVSTTLKSLEIASLLIGLCASKRGATKMRKEKKYLFSSPAIRYGFIKKLVGEEEGIGALREDTLVSTLRYLGFNIEYVPGKKKVPDYVVTKRRSQVVEVGGPGKTRSQLEKGIIVTDSSKLDYENGVAWIPLYLVALMSP